LNICDKKSEHRALVKTQWFDRQRRNEIFSHNLKASRFLPVIFPLGAFFAHMTKPAAASLPKTFDAAVTELETIVRQMETGELPLEQALERYQRGVVLLRHCQDKLGAAEQQIRILEGDATVPFAADDAGDAASEAGAK
jgi:exodeoxyribonuclease VII small subunit